MLALRVLGRRNINLTVSCSRSYRTSGVIRGFEEFYETPKKVNEVVHIGRGWTVPDLRRKGFSDLHKLWWVLYKERNLLLTEKEKFRRGGRPLTSENESRYIKVKRGMAAIKFVMCERRKIRLGFHEFFVSFV